MKIVTLTSDFGLADHYVASLKARCLKTMPNCLVVDITHQIKPFSSGQAAAVLKACFNEFEAGTVHIVAVDTEPVLSLQGHHKIPYIMEVQGQFIIVNNNGFVGAFLGDHQPARLWKIEDVLSNPKWLKFTSKNLYVSLAAQLMEGVHPDRLGVSTTEYLTAFSPKPIVEENLILGSIHYIDSYGNANTNIHRNLFEEVGKNHPFTLQIGRKDFIFDRIKHAYSEVDTGERIALYNEQGYIQIAINGGANKGSGGAEQLLGLKLDDQIRVDFLPKGSKEKLSDLLF